MTNNQCKTDNEKCKNRPTVEIRVSVLVLNIPLSVGSFTFSLARGVSAGKAGLTSWSRLFIFQAGSTLCTGVPSG
jgi:hypothetical protein